MSASQSAKVGGGGRAQRETWAATMGTGSDPGRALCFPVSDVAHVILNKAYRKVLDQLSRKKLLQKLVAKGVG